MPQIGDRLVTDFYIILISKIIIRKKVCSSKLGSNWDMFPDTTSFFKEINLFDYAGKGKNVLSCDLTMKLTHTRDQNK